MNHEKGRLYVLLALIPIALLPILFVPATLCRIIAAAVLAIITGVTFVLLKKRSIPSVNHRRVAGLLAVIAIVYLALYYMSGIRVGFSTNAIPLSVESVFRYILPSVVIIVAVEWLRYLMIAQGKKSAAVIAYITCIISDLLLAHGLANIGNIAHFLDIIGLSLFPAITSNILYHYLAKRYGVLPGIIFRVLLTLPMSLLPIVPNVSDVMQSFILIILPLATWAFVDMLYEKKAKYAKQRHSKWSYAGFGVILVCMTAVIMLISGHFRYHLLVIATPSMTGAINQGDAVIYEKYDGDVINENDVIVFTKDGETLIVHRVVDIQKINGIVYYTTKGDANEALDSGYLTQENIRGVVLCKVSHIGHPSLWIRDLFS